MSQPYVTYWPPCVGNEETIASLQDVEQDNTVVINATKPNVPGVFNFDKIIRSIIINSTDDISTAHFIVSGIGTPIDTDPALGNPTQVLGPITEDITGVDGINPIPSTNIYSQINSITVTGAPATNVFIGFGTFGITDYVFYDYNRIAAPISSLTLQFITDGGLQEISAAVFISLNKPESINISSGPVLEPFGKEAREAIPPLIAFIPAFQVIGPNETKNAINQVLGPYSVIWARIQGTSQLIQDSLYFTVIQQGIQ